MPMHLREILEPHRPELIDAVVMGLRASGAPHYQTVDPGLLARRAATLVDAFVAADGEPEPFIGYIQQLSHERITEGYYLNEIQTALNLLDQRAWAAVAEHAGPADVVRLVARVCRAVGAAKDELARIYLLRTRQAEERVVHLERQLKELFKGTDGGVVPED
ncbi:MAG TPA: hypothetical protein VGQ83_32770 [Polyangia bacterium]|jgi:hypothetical protein